MQLRGDKTRKLRVAAIFAATFFTMMIFFAVVAAACNKPIPCETKPSVTTQAATSVTHNSAWLNGQVNPHECETSFMFEYRKASAESWEKLLFGGSAGAGAFNQPVTDFLPSLSPETAYKARLTATSMAGSTTGGEVGFTTLKEPSTPKPPIVSTEAASVITTTGARLNGSVNPNGLSTEYRFEYGTSEGSLTNATSWVPIGTTSQKVTAEVSLEQSTKYYFRVSAKNADGTTSGSKLNFTTLAMPWKLLSTPNPAGASDSYLGDISCEPSTSVCTSVGTSTISSADAPIALRWNGSTWSEQTAAKKSGATHTRLVGVDCPSETRCLAVGNHSISGGTSVLSEIWNESKWNVQTTPVPAEATSSELVAIGCSSTANCTAVGSAVIGGVTTAVAEKWTSPTWALSSIPIPEGAESSQLDGVDCIWSNVCVAVGRYTTSGAAIKNYALLWNGTNWALQTLTDPEGAVQTTLLDVACTKSPTRCTAVGGWKNSSGEQFTLAYRFNGTTWTLQSTPNPTGAQASVFQEVSCATETTCTAAGSWVSKSGGSNTTLAEEWNGTTWSIQESPNPAKSTFSAFFGVSCQEADCLATGWSRSGAEVDTTMTQIRE